MTQAVCGIRDGKRVRITSRDLGRHGDYWVSEYDIPEDGCVVRVSTPTEGPDIWGRRLAADLAALAARRITRVDLCDGWCVECRQAIEEHRRSRADKLREKFGGPLPQMMSRPAEAAAWVLRGASYEETAVLMQVEVQTVKAHLMKAGARRPRVKDATIVHRLAARYREMWPNPVAVEQAVYDTDAMIERAVAAGATIAECAKATGRSHGMIRMRLHRARSRQRMGDVTPIERYLSDTSDHHRLRRGLGLPPPLPLWGNTMYGAYVGLAL